MTDEAPDIFGGGEGGGAPAISRKYVRPGESWGGILLPVGGTGTVNDQAYRTTQQTSNDNEPLFWDDGKPRWQGEITVLTEFRKMELFSDPMIARYKEDGREDDGSRRQFIKGSKRQDGAGLKEFMEAFQKAGAKRPEVGAIVKETFVKKVPLSGGKEAWYLGWEYSRPTPESLAKVQAYLDAKAEKSGGADAFGDDEPPF